MSALSIRMVIISIDALRGEIGDRIARCLTPAELDYSLAFQNPLYPAAARFCAKRAVQLWSASGEAAPLRLHEVEVVGTPFGPPQLCLRGDARRLAAARAVKTLHLSLSHCQHYAGALLAVTTDREEK